MKIVHLIASFSPGGAEVFTVNLAKALNSFGNHELEVWALTTSESPSFEEKMISELTAEGINVEGVGKKPHGDRVKAIFELRKLINKKSPDVLNTHLAHVTFYGVNANLFKDIPVIQTVHSTKIARPKMQKFYLNWFLDRFVAVSDKIKETLSTDVGIADKKLARILNGINQEEFEIEDRNVDDPVRSIVAIGRLEASKGYPDLLDSYSRLLNRMHNSSYDLPIPELYIVGQGDLKKKLLNISKKMNIDRFVNFLGIREDISDLLKEFDLYVMASHWEGLSISLMEALASGIPVLATNVGSNNELVRDEKNGLLVPPGKPEIMADKLEKLVLSPELRTKLSKGATSGMDKFNIKSTAKEYLSLYREVSYN